MKQGCKILLTGGSGILGREILKLIDNSKYTVYFPTSSELDIKDFMNCRHWFNTYKPDLVIHAAAYTDVKASEENYIRSINTNIVGTCNIINCCDLQNIKLVYISTDYVFDGNKGHYSINDPINPISKYAKSKASGELAVRMYPNSLVIRTSFYGHTFPYDKAFVDQWSSKDYIDKIAPKILNYCLSEKTGIVHAVSRKRTIYEIAVERRKNVQQINRHDVGMQIPKDVSLQEGQE